jgi:tetratricopeptide (TPR) repeat protein
MKSIWLTLLVAVVAPWSCAVAQNEYADSLKNALRIHPQEDSIRVNTLNLLAFETHFSYPIECLKYSEEAREIAQRVNYYKGIALSYRHTGLAHWTQAQFSLSITYFLKGLSVADSLNFLQIKADILGNIGLVKNGMGNPQEALVFFEKSLAVQRELKNKRREVIMLNNIGDCYFFMSQNEKALDAYQESLSIGKPMDFLIETNLRNIGMTYEAMGKLDSAMSYYKISLAIGERLREKREMGLVRKSMASTYLKMGNIGIAENLARQSLQIAKEANFRNLIRDDYFLLSEIANRQGKLNESLNFYKLHIAYKDSIQNLTETSKIAALQMDYEVQKKQIEISNLQKDAALKEEELLRKNTLLFSVIISLTLLTLFLAYYVRNFRFQKSINSLLKQQNQKVSALNEEIQSQQEEVVRQRDILIEKNLNIENLHNQLKETNDNLEKIVATRTATLKEQNKRLEEYAFLNAHDLRGPVARILGIINLLGMNHLTEDKPLLLDHLKKTSIELDQITRSISESLNSAISAYEETNSEKTESVPKV